MVFQLTGQQVHKKGRTNMKKLADEMTRDMREYLKSPEDIIDWRQDSQIASFYAGKSIFITGASGFVGKCLLEKLLRSCPDVKEIFILMRPKRGKEVGERVESLLRSELFDRIRSQPDGSGLKSLSKVRPIKGDITKALFGLSKESLELLSSRVNILFHSAATVKFEEALKVAVQNNVVSVSNLIEVSSKMRSLQALVHVSTAYSNCNRKQVDEIFYETPIQADKLIEMASWMDDDVMDRISPSLLMSKSRPNTYTYTKAVAESMIFEKASKLLPNIPIAVVRPSIVAGIWRQPIRGWVDNFNGPTGVMLAMMSGALQAMHVCPNYCADIVPVDIVANLIICSAWQVHSQHFNNNNNNKKTKLQQTTSTSTSLSTSLSTNTSSTNASAIANGAANAATNTNTNTNITNNMSNNKLTCNQLVYSKENYNNKCSYDNHHHHHHHQLHHDRDANLTSSCPSVTNYPSDTSDTSSSSYSPSSPSSSDDRMKNARMRRKINSIVPYKVQEQEQEQVQHLQHANGTSNSRTCSQPSPLQIDINATSLSSLINNTDHNMENLNSSQCNNQITIFNCVSGSLNPLAWSDFPRYIIKVAKLYPISDAIRLPGSLLISSEFLFKIYNLLDHSSFAHFGDFMLKLSGGKPKLVVLHQRLMKAIKTLKPFTTNQWIFNCTNTTTLYDKLSPIDRNIFNFDTRQVVWGDYLQRYYVGAKIYAVKDDPMKMFGTKRRLNCINLCSKIAQTLIMIVAYYFLIMGSTFETRTVETLRSYCSTGSALNLNLK